MTMPPAKTESTGARGTRPVKVLVIDDDPLVLRILRDRLVEAGFLVTTTSAAFGAIQMVEEIGPDVVVLDVMMPALPGNKIAELIRQRFPGRRLGILLYSGRELDDLPRLAAECGADDWIAKSDDYAALVARISALAVSRGTSG